MPMDFTGPESQDWMRGKRRGVDTERTTAAEVQAAEYSEGTKVDVDGQEGVVVEVRTSGFTGPDGSDVDASDDSPAYVVATVDGATVVRGDDLTASDWGSDIDDPAADLADDQSGDDAEARRAAEALELYAGVQDFDYPDSWEESDTPARLILLDAWAGMNGQFDCPSGDCCKGTMLRSGMSNRAANQFCASMKDRVLLWEGWRQGG